MRVVVPFGTARPKTRLEPPLEGAERRTLARSMLRDVLAALRSIDRQPTVLADDTLDVDAPVSVDPRPLTEAVDAVLPSDPGEDSVAVVMADLALATPRSLERLFEPDADVVLAPGRGGGTNALVARDPAFGVDYHGASIRDHRRLARAAGLGLAEVDSYRLAIDVDEPADLVEVLLHAPPESDTRRWLEDAGFDLRVTDGRAQLRRD